MTYLLAIDTSTPETSVALCSRDKIFTRTVSVADSHNETLAQMVDEVFQEGAIAISQLQGILLGSGPGSFTGLRIGFSFAQGLSIASGIPIRTVSSLYAIAFDDQQRYCASIADARRNELFCSLLEITPHGIQVLIEPCILTPPDFEKALKDKVLLKEVSLFSVGNSSLGATSVTAVATRMITLWQKAPTLFAPASSSPKELAILKPLYVRPVSALTIEERNMGIR